MINSPLGQYFLDYSIMMNLLPDNEGSSPVGRGELHDLKLFVWNVRGAGNIHFLNELKEHLRLHRPHIVALLETH